MFREGFEWTLIDSPLTLEEVTAPTVIPDNALKLYAKDKAGVSALYYMDDAEVEHDLSGGITGSGVANRLAYWTGAAVLDDVPRTLTPGSVLFVGSDFLPQEDNSNLFFNDTSNWLAIGGPAAQVASAAGIGKVRLSGASNNERFEASAFGASAAPGFQGSAGAGTEASPTASTADMILSFLAGGGYDNTPARVITNKGLVGIKAGEAWTTTAQGTYLTFETTPLLSTTRAERFRIGPSGQLGIAGATYGTAGQALLSGGAGAPPTWGSAGVTDHGALTGLSDDDHTQYVLRTGRTGSTNNIIINLTTGYPDGKITGTNVSGAYLILESTTHATKGKILFGNSAYDEVNNRLGLGDNGPTARLELFGTGVAHTALKIGNSDANDEGIINRIYARVSSGSAAYIGTQFNMRDAGSTGTTTNLNQIIVLSGTAVSGSNYANKMQLQNIKTGGSVSNLIGLSVDMPHNSASGHNVSQVNFFVVDSSNLYSGSNTFSTVIGYRCTNLFRASTGTGFAFLSEGGINDFSAGDAANIVLKIRGAASQTANLQEWQTSASGILLAVLAGGQLKTSSGNETTGAGSALLGANSPAVTNTAPFTWLKFTSSDGSQVYVPAWK